MKSKKTVRPLLSVVSTVSKNEQYSKVLKRLSDKETKALARAKKIEAQISGKDFRRAQEAEIDALTDAFLTNRKKAKNTPLK